MPSRFRSVGGSIYPRRVCDRGQGAAWDRSSAVVCAPAPTWRPP